MIKQIILHKFLLEKKNVIACTSIMGAVILFFATIAADTYVDNTNIYRVDYDRAVNVANVAICFCFIYTASRMFRDLNSRKTAIRFLMLPASNKDKFLANCIMDYHAPVITGISPEVTAVDFCLGEGAILAPDAIITALEVHNLIHLLAFVYAEDENFHVL